MRPFRDEGMLMFLIRIMCLINDFLITQGLNGLIFGCGQEGWVRATKREQGHSQAH
jgi:hypothetical protein